MTAYYNEHDPFAAAWLRELIKAGHIAPGIVDERSIEDVLPIELAGFTQCHFFAGIGVWSYALRRAGWPDDRQVWTGSCPCQPFSAAGKGAGFADERHLWPAFHHLIAQRKPPVLFGEQVASKAVDAWIDLVQADLEAVGYAFGSVPFPVAGVGAPHIRDRNFWVAQSASNRCAGRRSGGKVETRPTTRRDAERSPSDELRKLSAGFEGSSVELLGWLGNNNNPGLEGLGRGYQTEGGRVGEAGSIAETGELGRVADAASCEKYQEQQRPSGVESGRGSNELGGCSLADLSPSTRPTNSFWSDADWLFCRDGKWRPVEPGTFPLVNGAAARVGRLRGYGNAINAEAAKAFIESYLDL